MTRVEATRMLGVERVGTFAVLFANRKPGPLRLAHTMSMADGEICVNHVMLRVTAEGAIASRAEQDEKLFDSLEAMVAHYSDSLLQNPYVSKFYQQPWWHGDIEATLAESLLENQRKGFVFICLLIIVVLFVII